MIQSQGGKKEWVAFVVLVAASVLDRFLKMLAEQPQFTAHPRGWRYFAFEQFHNAGVAFSLPVHPWLALPITVVLLAGLGVFVRYALAKHPTSRIYIRTAAAAIVLGALSNALDRALYGYTIDYLRIVDSIINIADIQIIYGVYLFFRSDFIRSH